MAFNREIQVVIVGAGIGGLSLAVFFRQAGIQPVVIEADEEFDQQGNVVELWPEATALLERLGVAEAVRDAGTVVTEWTQRQPDGTVVDRLVTNPPGGFLTIPYGRLREQLLEHIGPDAIRTGITLRSLDASDHPVTVSFENGVREQFDLVIGADGVNSRTRALIGGPGAVPCGTASCAFPLPARTGLSGANEIWTADGTVFRTLPVTDHLMGLLTVPTDTLADGTVDPARISALEAKIEWLGPKMVDGLTANDIWAAEDIRVPTDRWAEGHVALVGDAAHARHRLAGMGATLAIEDAAVLVSELVDREDALSARLADYAGRRRSRLQRLSDHPETTSSRPLKSTNISFPDDQARILEIRGGQLAAAFGPGTPQPAVGPLSSQW